MKTVKIISAGPCGNGTVIEAADGTLIPGVEKAVVTLESDKPNRADLTIAFVDFAAREAEAVFFVLMDGKPKPVRRIEFEDGSEWSAT